MRTWFYGPGSVLTRAGMLLLGPLHVEGLGNVPRQGAFILVGNHVSNLDPLIIGSTAGHRAGRLIHFLSKQELRRWPVIGWLATQSGVYFVRRGEGDRAAQRLSLRFLADGEPVGFFPEGHRSKDGVLHAGHDGAALLAIRAGVPVLPVGISGTGGIFPGRSRLPHRSSVKVRIGEPFSLPHQPEGRLDRAMLTAGTDRIMREIAALLPADQRGPYA
jgi:1-acyl-sn-glycerol-3-phosphate acyltransferase